MESIRQHMPGSGSIKSYLSSWTRPVRSWSREPLLRWLCPFRVPFPFSFSRVSLVQALQESPQNPSAHARPDSTKPVSRSGQTVNTPYGRNLSRTHSLNTRNLPGEFPPHFSRKSRLADGGTLHCATGESRLTDWALSGSGKIPSVREDPRAPTLSQTVHSSFSSGKQPQQAFAIRVWRFRNFVLRRIMHEILRFFTGKFNFSTRICVNHRLTTLTS